MKRLRIATGCAIGALLAAVGSLPFALNDIINPRFTLSGDSDFWGWSLLGFSGAVGALIGTLVGGLAKSALSAARIGAAAGVALFAVFGTLRPEPSLTAFLLFVLPGALLALVLWLCLRIVPIGGLSTRHRGAA